MHRMQMLVLIIVLLPATHLYAQHENRNHSVIPGAPFEEGLYLSIDMVTGNSPIPPSWIESDTETFDREFYIGILEVDEMDYHDFNGIRQTIQTIDIWGFGYKGKLNIKIGPHFHEILFIGCVSYFYASETVYSPIEHIRGYPFASHYVNIPEIILAKHKEYLIDFNANNVFEFNIWGFETILKNDPVLLNEFNGLNKQRKKHLKYKYLGQYNERNPCK